jgi:hypothetical protein
VPRIFDDWIKAYIDYTSQSEAPDRYHFWTAVSTIAGAMRRRVWIDQLHFQWTPNFYILLVGPAGVVTKSTTMNSGMGLLERNKEILFGPESLTWQALGEDLMDAGRALEYNGEKTVISCLTIAASEGGSLLKLEDDGLVSMLIGMWDGQKSVRPWMHKTRSQKTIEIRNPWLNIIACTTPTWLRVNFPEHIVGGGLTSRIIFVYAEQKRKFVAYPRRTWERSGMTVDEHRELGNTLSEDLKEIAALKGPMSLTDAAMDWGEQWYMDLQRNRPKHLASSRFDSYLARKQTHLHKLAMVMTAADKNLAPAMLIDAPMLQKCNAILDDVERDMIKVFESIGLVEEAQQRSEITQFLRIHKDMKIEDLWRLCSNVMRLSDFETNVKAGLEAGFYERFSTPGSRFGIRLKP